jgi:hypothetical protein
MSSVSKQGPLSPNDPEYYAPARVRDRLSLPQGPGLEPINSPVSLPASLNTQPVNSPPDALRRPLYSETIRQPAGLERELDWRGELFSLAARFALAAGVVTVVALLFFILVPASRQPDTASTASESAGSARAAVPPSGQAAVPPSGQVDLAAKPALSQFKGLLATAPVAVQPAAHDQSQQLLQGFMQWRQKANSNETSR